MDKQGKFAVIAACLCFDDGFRALLEWLSGFGIEKARSGWLDEECAEHSMLLVAVGKEMIVEKDGVQLFICIEPFDQRFILPRPSNVVPAIGRTV